MAKRLTRRQRLKRDPNNQAPGRARAWAVRHGYGPALEEKNRFADEHPWTSPRGHGHRLSQRLWSNFWYRFHRVAPRAQPVGPVPRAIPDEPDPIAIFVVRSPWH